LPQPFGPTIPVSPSLRSISVGSKKDLNPEILIDLNFICFPILP